MGGIDAIRVVEQWVFDDLSSGTFSTDEQEQVLDDIEDFEEQLVLWDRPLTKCVEILSTAGTETIYRRRVGDLRTYFLRDGATLYCIGVGKRKTTYDRDIDTILDRATRYQSE